MKVIDLNADLGEADTPEGQKAEADILSYISSANIACGGHAGDEQTMRNTIRAAKANGVVIGAHPSYPDRENFGRRSKPNIDDVTLRNSLMAQIVALTEIASEENVEVVYVKPHGAIYNDAAVDRNVADLLVNVVVSLDNTLLFMGSPDSELEKAAKVKGLTFIGEGFIDRRYTDDGRLQSRAIDGAVIKDQNARMAQTLSLVKNQTVTSAAGKTISVPARTLCLHGDSAGAVETARQARAAIEAAGITIRAFAHDR